MQHEPTLDDVLADLWHAKIKLLTGAVLGLIMAVVFLMIAVPHYRATVLVAPPESSYKTLVPDYSAFTIQDMMSTKETSDSRDFIRLIHILRAPSVAGILLKDKRILKGVAEDIHFGFQQGKNSPVDSADKLAAYLEKTIKVEPVGTTPLRQIIYKHPDRAFSVYLLHRLHEEADHIIRQEIRDKTQNRTAYLEKALMITDHPDHRRTLTSLLMEQEYIQMILVMNEPFAAMIAEPPAASVEPYWPRASVIFPVFMLGGMFLGYVVYAAGRKRIP